MYEKTIQYDVSFPGGASQFVWCDWRFHWLFCLVNLMSVGYENYTVLMLSQKWQTYLKNSSGHLATCWDGQWTLWWLWSFSAPMRLTKNCLLNDQGQYHTWFKDFHLHAWLTQSRHQPLFQLSSNKILSDLTVQVQRPIVTTNKSWIVIFVFGHTFPG